MPEILKRRNVPAVFCISFVSYHTLQDQTRQQLQAGIATFDPVPYARELGESYSLGYTPANTIEGGKFRRIEVRVRKPGLQVTQTRSGFQP